MSVYHHDEVRAAKTIYEKAKVQAARIVQQAKLEAEREANLIREKARMEGLVMADAEIFAREQARKRLGQARLMSVAREAYPNHYEGRLAA